MKIQAVSVATVALIALVQGQPLGQPRAVGGSADVAAYVNGEAVPRQILEWSLAHWARTLEQSVDRTGTNTLAAAGQPSAGESVLQALIDTELLYQESRRRQITVTEGEVALELEVVRRSPEAFADMVIDPGDSPAVIATRIARKLAVDKLLKLVAEESAGIEGSRIREFFEANRKHFAQEEQVRLADIFVKAAGNASTTRVAPPRCGTEAVRARLAAGERFAAVGRDCSDDFDDSRRGGDRGFFRRSELPEEIAGAAFSLDVGGVSPFIATADGYHVIKLLARLPQREPALPDVEAVIRKYLVSQQQQERLKELIDSLRATASIVLITDGASAASRGEAAAVAPRALGGQR